MNHLTRRPLMILITGPHRSGTGNDPALMAANLAALRRAALPLFQAGHLPVTAEELALPLALLAGATRTAQDVLQPFAKRLLARSDAVLRVGGPSQGADRIVRLALWEGKPVYYHAEDITPITYDFAPDRRATPC